MLKHKFCFLFIFGLVVYGSDGRSLDLSRDNDGIIGGKEVDITQYPHQVAVLYKEHLHCGGSILSEKYVLTAAHCVENISPQYISLRVGSSYHAKGGVEHRISSTYIQARFNKTSRFDYDVAVFEVSEKIVINGNTTKAVQLAKSGSSLKPNELMEVSGWGITESGSTSNVLKAVTLPAIDKESCKKYYEGLVTITDRMLCAGYVEPGQTTCNGDSGGPLINKKTSEQFGIVSFGAKGCMQPNKPTVFTFIPAVRDWIHRITGV